MVIRSGGQAPFKVTAFRVYNKSLDASQVVNPLLSPVFAFDPVDDFNASFIGKEFVEFTGDIRFNNHLVIGSHLVELTNDVLIDKPVVPSIPEIYESQSNEFTIGFYLLPMPTPR